MEIGRFVDGNWFEFSAPFSLLHRDDASDQPRVLSDGYESTSPISDENYSQKQKKVDVIFE